MHRNTFHKYQNWVLTLPWTLRIDTSGIEGRRQLADLVKTEFCLISIVSITASSFFRSRQSHVLMSLDNVHMENWAGWYFFSSQDRWLCPSACKIFINFLPCMQDMDYDRYHWSRFRNLSHQKERYSNCKLCSNLHAKLYSQHTNKGWAYWVLIK